MIMDFDIFTKNVGNSCQAIIDYQEKTDYEWKRINTLTKDFLYDEMERILSYGYLSPYWFEISRDSFNCDIETSREIKTVSYGDLDTKRIIQEIKKIISNYKAEEIRIAEPIGIILDNKEFEENDEKIIDSIQNCLDNWILEDNEESDDGSNKIVKEIMEILHRRRIIMDVGGEFYPFERPQRNKIIIYIYTIWESAKRLYDCYPGFAFEELYAASLSMVLIHELFHAFHYEMWLDKNGFSKKQWSSRRYVQEKEAVREGLADFYSVCVSIDASRRNSQSARGRVAELKYQEWLKYRYSKWPYACALEFYKIGPGRYDACEDYDRHGEKMKNVFRESLTSWRRANEILKK